MNVAIYARVSTAEQSVDMQVSELQAYASRMNWTIIGTYCDKGVSGTKDSRPDLNRLMHDVRLRRFDAVIVWKLDRFGRSLSQLVSNVATLDQCGVRFMSLTEGIDTDQKSPTGRLMLNLFASFSEFERSLIVERVNAGIREAKRKGVHTGRPARVFRRDVALRMREEGHSYRSIAQTLGVPTMTVVDAIKQAVRKPRPDDGATDSGNMALASA